MQEWDFVVLSARGSLHRVDGLHFNFPDEKRCAAKCCAINDFVRFEILFLRSSAKDKTAATKPTAETPLD
jgi:hypothetical protein